MASRKKARSGAVAMKHAVAVLEHAGYTRLQKAGKRILFVRGKVMALREDIFGVFDLYAIGPGLESLLIQVTSQTDARQTVANRQRKIEREFLPGFLALPRERIEVWAWVNAKGFRRWRLEEKVELEADLATYARPDPPFAWTEIERMASPLLKRDTASVPW